MIAKLQKIITIAALALAALAVAMGIMRDHPISGAAIALLILCSHAIVLAAEFVAMHRINASDPTLRASTMQVFRAWCSETISALVVFCWRQPFGSRLHPDHLPSNRPARGVVLVHGFVCNRGVWNRWLRHLHHRSVPFIAVNLEPVFGSIDAYAPIIDTAVARLQATTGRAPVIVGHSMGGLAIRAWLASTAGADDRVHRVITMGSPHGGTRLADLSMTPNGHQMKVGGPWLAQLEAREPPERFSRFTCFYGNCDNIVFPASAAMRPQAANRHLAGVGHVHMVDHPEPLAELQRWLNT